MYRFHSFKKTIIYEYDLLSFAIELIQGKNEIGKVVFSPEGNEHGYGKTVFDIGGGGEYIKKLMFCKYADMTFCTCYKVIDALVEFVLIKEGQKKPIPPRHWTFKDKDSLFTKTNLKCSNKLIPMLKIAGQFYSNLREYRNQLIHEPSKKKKTRIQTLDENGIFLFAQYTVALVDVLTAKYAEQKIFKEGVSFLSNKLEDIHKQGKQKPAKPYIAMYAEYNVCDNKINLKCIKDCFSKREKSSGWNQLYDLKIRYASINKEYYFPRHIAIKLPVELNLEDYHKFEVKK
jgi:hypothetical protein